mgnify:CR=1 FL=1
MDLRWDETPRMLSDSVQRLLANPPAAVDGTDAQGLWHALAALGVLGMGFEEAQGGMGARAQDSLVVLEALGRAAAAPQACPRE